MQLITVKPIDFRGNIAVLKLDCSFFLRVILGRMGPIPNTRSLVNFIRNTTKQVFINVILKQLSKIKILIHIDKVDESTYIGRYSLLGLSSKNSRLLPRHRENYINAPVFKFYT
ncbi:hypothetical protein Misp06_02464 [Microbulbifer sp. NBRC 101763]